MTSVFPACAVPQRFFLGLLFSGPRSAPSLPSRTAGKTSGSWVGRPLDRPSPYAQSSRSRLKVESARPRVPRPCRTVSPRRLHRRDFAGQLLVSEPPASGLAKCPREAIAVICLAVVVPESLFVQITEQMEGFDAHVSTFQSTFQERPEILDPVRVDISLHIALGVIDHVMDVLAIKSEIANQLVGENIGTGCYMVAHFAMQRFPLGIGNVHGADLLRVPVQQAHHDGLARSASAGDFGLFIFVHEAGESANVRFIGFDLAFHLVPEGALLHRQTNPLEHEPSGFLSYAQILRDLIRTDSVLAIGQQPDGGQPLVETDGRILKDSSDLDAELATVVLGAAFPTPLIGEKVNLVASADRTFHSAIRPAQSDHELKADIRVFEVANRVQQGSRDHRCHAVKIANGSGLVKYIIALNWAGGKRWLVPHLAELWTAHQHRRLVEPFCGGLAVALSVRPVRALLNDINPHVVHFYLWLKRGLKVKDGLEFDNREALYYEHRR